MKITSDMPDDWRRAHVVVRRDFAKDVEGEIVEADDETGEVMLMVAGEKVKVSFGSDAIRIVRRR